VKIGILIPEFPSQTHIFFWREVVELRRVGIGVTLISTRRPPDAACRHEFAAAARAETHYVYPPRWLRALLVLVAHPIGAVRALGYLRRLERTTLRQRVMHLGLLLCAADLFDHARRRRLEHIHAHSCADAAHLVALCRVLGGPPYSLMLHGDLAVYGRDHASKMERASFVFCAGPHLVEQIVDGAHYPADRVIPSWMGIDTDRFVDAGARGYRPRVLHLITVARLDECKGHRFALAALRALVDRGVDARYTLVGEGPFRTAIENEITGLGLSDRVELVGTQSESEVLRLLQHADVFVLPSVGLGEAYGVATLEAMSCSMPVVCSRIGSIPLVVEHGVAGFLVDQGDVAGLMDAFDRLAADPALRRQMGAAARRRAVETFGVQDTTENLIRAIRAHSPGSRS